MPTWSPLLDGDDAARAMEAVDDVAAALTPEAVASSGWSLGGGAPGIALLHVALFEATGAEAHRARALSLFDESIDAVVAQPQLDPAFYGTTVGLSWALGRAGARMGEEDTDENDVDELVTRLLTMAPWPGHFDVISGITGLGAYCLDRLPRASARTGLDLAVARLAERAERTPEGATWLTTPAFYAPRADVFPNGHYDVGFAHGSAGVVAFLAGATRAGAAGAEELLRDALRWLLARRGPGGDKGVYPSMLGPDGKPSPARLAWCYGDLGVSFALLGAGRALGDETLVEESRALALGCVGRVETSGVVDATLCHGTAGAGHLFHRLARAHDDERIADLARFWFVRALDKRGPEGAVAGFAGKPDPGTTTQRPSYGLVEGVAGTALALVTAATGAEPWWDYPFLLGTADA